MKNIKIQPDNNNTESGNINSTTSRDFKTDNLDLSYIRFFNVFRLFLAVLDFGDNFSIQANALKKVFVTAGKIFLFFLPFMHMFIIVSSIFFDHNIDKFWKINEFVLSFSSLIQTIIWYRNRKHFRKTIAHLWKKYYDKSIHKSRKKLQALVCIGFLFSSVFIIVAFVCMYKTFHVDLSYIDVCFFGLIAKDKTVRKFLSFLTSLSWIWIPLKNSVFVLYYCFLCQILRSLINELIISIDTEDASVIINMYSSIIHDITFLDNHFSGLLGMACWICLHEIFVLEYMIVKGNDFTPHRYLIIIWYAILLLSFLLCASLANESLDDVKYFINQQNVFDASNRSIRFILKACFVDSKLTIWKILVMRRITIFSILGTFITYNYLLIF